MNRSAVNELLNAIGRKTGPVPQYQSHILVDLGGDANAVSDYSGVTYPFYYTPGAGNVFRVHRLLVTVADTAVAADNYGNVSELTHGVEVATCTGMTNIKQSLTGILPVRNNVGWAVHCYDMKPETFGVGDAFINVRWTFTKGGAPIRLDGDADEYFTVFCNDTLTGLTRHNFVIQGYLE